VAKSIWEGRIGKNANKKNMGPCNKSERRFCPKERKDIPDAKVRERRGARVCRRAVEERVH